MRTLKRAPFRQESSARRIPRGQATITTERPRAYVDIETTGFSPYRDELTVVGICLERGRTHELVQLYDDNLTRKNILAALDEITSLYTYNGARFDLPFIAAKLGVDLASELDHCDLMHHCWRRNLWGGQKAVEFQLGISRETKGMAGIDAVRLWHAYKRRGDAAALRMLLLYNAEDVTNLAHIRRRLKVR